MNSTAATSKALSREFPMRPFLMACLIVSVWVNASEVFRYFVFVMPMIRSSLSMVPDVAPMNLGVFLIWGIWDTILVAMAVLVYWLWSAQFGSGLKSIVVSGTLSWLFFFVLFWVGLMNMRLAGRDMLAIALPLAWLELVIASAIAEWSFRRFARSQ
jgi:hypothetical protein